ncbi:MAG: hypothetical protein H6819_03450 [Phycisphaerales bacterium]|nr:hypothetical protein [Phycisphaerales bacterium]MCB9856252.1 hypothetical protein [Phycisphaerales bacterium]MCB9863309.1 hypothetical protein [Phycisphaerales bacterium]
MDDIRAIPIFRITPLRVMLRRRPATVPPAIWTRVVDGMSWSSVIARVCAYAYAIGAVMLAIPMAYVVSAGFLTSNVISVTRLWVWAWCLTALGVTALGYFFFWTAIGAAQANLMVELRESDYRLCTTCGYNLIGAGLRAVCPECGADFDADEALETWREVMSEPRI